MRWRALIPVVAFGLLVAPAPVLAQRADSGLAIESVEVDEYPKTRVLVSMPAGVAHGSLPEDAFTLLEDGEPQSIDVSAPRSSDLEVLLLMDATGSMDGEPIAAAKAAATQFVRQLPRDTSLSVMRYETAAAVESKFSTNHQSHIDAIDGLTAKGETAMYDALGKALNEFSSGGNARRAIVLLTDGEDNSSNISLEAITKKLGQSDVALYAVKFSTAFTDSAALQKMVSATGGEVRKAEDSGALLRVYNEIATALVNQYAIEYTSSGHGTVPITLEVDDGGATGEARTTVKLPPAPAPVPEPEPAVAEIVSVDVAAYPEVTLTVRTPEQLADQELTRESFVLLEGDTRQQLTMLQQDDSQTYRVQYLSGGQGEVDLSLQVRSGAVSADATSNATLPTIQPAAPQTRTALLVGAVLVFVGAALLLLILFAGGDGRARRSVVNSLGGSRTKRPSAVAGMADWATTVADRSLTRGNRRGSLNLKLEQAGINLRPGEFVVMSVCIVITALVLGRLLFGGLFMGILSMIVAIIGCRAYLSFKAGRRRTKFANQLSDTLQLLAGSLRAGYSVLQAVDAVSREAESPTAEEFRRLVVETRLGRDLNEALSAMRERAGNEDFDWVVQAIGINREVGGDLAEVLDTVGHTIRERNQIRRQVKALSAEGKLSAIVLLALPFVVGFMIMMSNPDYLTELTASLLGNIMLGIAALMMAAGTFWLAKIVRFKF